MRKAANPQGLSGACFKVSLAAKVIHEHMVGGNRRQIKKISFFGVCFHFVIWASFMSLHHNLGSKIDCPIVFIVSTACFGFQLKGKRKQSVWHKNTEMSAAPCL